MGPPYGVLAVIKDDKDWIIRQHLHQISDNDHHSLYLGRYRLLLLDTAWTSYVVSWYRCFSACTCMSFGEHALVWVL
jgi:hypothetical protein